MSRPSSPSCGSIRELFYFFVWRDVKVRYAQSVLGVGWAIIQPLVPMILFTIVFGRVAENQLRRRALRAVQLYRPGAVDVFLECR